MKSDGAGEELMALAREAVGRAYAPYSGFPVGAAILTADGTIFTGCNVEVASVGLTICAEQVAAVAAVSAGKREFIAVAITAPKVVTVTPCGACRQFLNEFRPAQGDLVIYLEGEESVEAVSLESLFPRSFGPRDLA